MTDEGYVGGDVHRAARIAAAGHGGQILVSASTAALLEGDSLIDLGEHRFKDLAAPERVYQLGDGAFPPLQSLQSDEPPHSGDPVPRAGARAGRGRRAPATRRAPSSHADGAGGTGKSRLALQAVAEAAESYPDGLWWVSAGASAGRTTCWSLLWRRLFEVEEQAGHELGEILGRRLSGVGRSSSWTTPSTCCPRSLRRSRASETWPARRSSSRVVSASSSRASTCTPSRRFGKRTESRSS